MRRGGRVVPHFCFLKNMHWLRFIIFKINLTEQNNIKIFIHTVYISLKKNYNIPVYYKFFFF